MLKRFTGLAILSTITILTTSIAAGAGQIRLRTISNGNYTEIVYVETGKPKNKPRYFQIIHDYPNSSAAYFRRVRRQKDTYIAKCDDYEMSNVIKTETYDKNNDIISLNTYENRYLSTPRALSFEELALQATCKTP